MTHAHSEDQAEALAALVDVIHKGTAGVFAVTGKAGSGKTHILSDLVQAAIQSGIEIIEPDFERQSKKKTRTLAILTPTNKASAVLRRLGVPATTLHRILYKPIYHPDYEAVAEWLIEKNTPPKTEKFTSDALEKLRGFYEKTTSIPAAFAMLGMRESDFIKGWARRGEKLDIGLIDESSMLDTQQIQDLKESFQTLILFGDPFQLAPVGQADKTAFDHVSFVAHHRLARIHRQSTDHPIRDLALALAEDNLDYADFVALLQKKAAQDARILIKQTADCELMSRSPMLVWRNATRIRLILGFRKAYEIPEAEIRPGEPLICDGMELPAKYRNKRIDLEARGLIKGAQAFYLGPGSRPGFSKLYITGTPEPYISAASIIQIESTNQEEISIVRAAKMGAYFLHGAAITIHKAQGSQWPDVQVFAPDIYAAMRSGRIEAGIPLWKRLAYVALTRAETRLIWVTDYRLSKPTTPLDSFDLRSAIRTAQQTPKLQGNVMPGIEPAQSLL